MFLQFVVTLALCFTSALVIAADPDVSFLPPSVVNASILQVYSPNHPVYYDVVEPHAGAPLRTIDSNGVRPLGLLGTKFNFVPTNSSFMGYIQLKTLNYGHLALASNSSLHLSINASDSAFPTPRLALASKVDDVTQLNQFWSLDPYTGFLTFLGTIYTIESFAPIGYEPIPPISPPEDVHVTTIFSTIGRFYLKGA